jgi:hypothetical protein
MNTILTFNLPLNNLELARVNPKKPPSIKQKIREERKREQQIGIAVTVAILIAIICVSGFLLYSMFFSSSEDVLPKPTLQFEPADSSFTAKAAIVDHLSLTIPNKTFVQTVATILTKANYTVDYFGGEEVTVNFYRNLPTGEYKLIILRVHSALDANNKPPLALFTSEPLDSRKHVNEQLTDQVQGVAFLPYKTGDKTYFGILSKFIKTSMKGLQNSIIIAMGCDGLTYTDMAQAFIEKGARTYISWNGSVSASHTDQATTQLLQHLVTEGQTIKQAVENTMKEVGPDPGYDNTLEYYPLESGKYAIQN